MKELDLAVFVAVFREMLGPLLWLLVGLAVAAVLGFAAVLLRDRGIRPRRLLWAELAGLAGGVGAIVLMLAATSSRLADLGGPIDWLLGVGIFAAGMIGATLGAYALLGLFRRLA